MPKPAFIWESGNDDLNLTGHGGLGVVGQLPNTLPLYLPRSGCGAPGYFASGCGGGLSGSVGARSVGSVTDHILRATS